jgi:pimeloyl-ACP methyl ester carboxylesterase
MGEAVSDGLTIHYDTFGSPRDPAVLLVMGLGTQMIAWRTEFCEALAARGLFVVRFDNRDVGLSTKLHAVPLPFIPRTMVMRQLGMPVRSAYSLSDMARDAIAVLDAVGAKKAHVAGVSMGGMIAQTLAIEHPERVLSLTSIMSSPGEPGLPWPTPAARGVLLRSAPRSREEAIEGTVSLFRVIGSPRYFDEVKVRRRGAEAYDRCSYRLGTARQLDAILCARPRAAALSRIRIPATVVHGKIDPLVPLAHGLATAEAIPGARTIVIDELAHDLPDELGGPFAEAIGETIGRA